MGFMKIMRILFPTNFISFVKCCVGTVLGCGVMYLVFGDALEALKVEIQILAIVAAGTVANITHQEE